MNSFDYFQKNIAVLGFGVEGISVVGWLLAQKGRITVFDEKKRKEDVAEAFSQFEKQGVVYVYGPFPDLTLFDVVIVSPSIRMDRPQILNAIEKGVNVTTPTNIFMDLTPCPVIGVTGTKGKGTTSALIYEMLKSSGRDAYLGGNIGTPPLDFVDKLTPQSIVVLELSSFQIMNMTKSPHIAVVLMVTSEHLDYHKDTNEYVLAKANIVKHQKPGDWAIVNVNYPNSVAAGRFKKFGRLEISTKYGVSRGVHVKDGMIVFQNKRAVEEIMRCDEIYIPGKHNWENAIAAAAVAKLTGVSNESIRSVLRGFKGLPHRLEFIREVDGVKYYDDSFSTTPETAIAAITAFEQPKILILGGSSKNSDFTELGRLISESNSIRAIVGIGVEWPRIREHIVTLLHCYIVEDCKNMKEIVEAARKVAKPGDAVLLSPACASFDMFKNYKDRGEQFKQQVDLL